MTDLWKTIVEAEKLGQCCEAAIHPHAPEERAELFHSRDAGTTELEYLNLLLGLVCAYKPRNILETGTFYGFGAMALACGCKANGFGRVFTVDQDPCEFARERAGAYGLDIEFTKGDSLGFCSQAGTVFDLMLFDTELSIRHVEFDILDRRKMVNRPALAIFHDSSALRTGHVLGHAMNEYIGKRFANRIELPYSRGLTICQV